MFVYITFDLWESYFHLFFEELLLDCEKIIDKCRLTLLCGLVFETSKVMTDDEVVVVVVVA